VVVLVSYLYVAGDPVSFNLPAEGILGAILRVGSRKGEFFPFEHLVGDDNLETSGERITVENSLSEISKGRACPAFTSGSYESFPVLWFYVQSENFVVFTGFDVPFFKDDE
jgi:hypothetical protein